MYLGGEDKIGAESWAPEVAPLAVVLGSGLCCPLGPYTDLNPLFVSAPEKESVADADRQGQEGINGPTRGLCVWA